jgi:hypothetical protein
MQWPETIRNGGRLYWKPRSTMDCSNGGRVEKKKKQKNTGTWWTSYKILATHTQSLKAPE